MSDLREKLRHCFQGSVCLMGIGNIDQGDDGLGAGLADAIAARVTGSGDVPLNRTVINAGAMPERLIGSAAERGFDHLVFLDAVEFGVKPGSVIFLNAEEIATRFPQISTHKISISVLAKWIRMNGKTQVWLLGVQPGSLKPGQGLSPAVRRTMEILEDLLCDVWTSMKNTDETVLQGDLVRA